MTLKTIPPAITKMLQRSLFFYMCTNLGTTFSDSHEPGSHRLSKPSFSPFARTRNWGHCGVTFQLKISEPIIIKSQDFGVRGKVYGQNLDCDWAFIGNPDCTPTVQCTVFDLQNLERDCATEYMEVSDGSGAAERFCGNGKILTPIKSRTRDLYIRFKSGSNLRKKIYTGFQCEVKCLPNPKFINYSFNKSQHREDIRCICGFQNKQDRIVGGVSAKFNEFPWLVAIVFNGTRMPLCGGSIINDRYILTSAHCTPSGIARPSEIEVLAHAGILDLTMLPDAQDVKFGEPGSFRGPGYELPETTDADEKSLRLKVVEIFSHPLFSLPEFDYDVALLKLEKKIDFTLPDAPTPICLPTVNDLGQNFEGKLATVSGWGLVNENAGASTRSLQKLQVPILPFKTCLNGIPFLTPRQFCAGFVEGKRDSCGGDSGGPLALKKISNQWIQIGIVSFGVGCAEEHFPGVYARISELNSWIRHNSADGTWCRSI